LLAGVRSQRCPEMQLSMENEASLALDGENIAFERNWAFPMSFAQQRFWLLNQLEPGNTAYSIPCSMRLRGKLNVEALENSLNEIVSRHEVFRTTFKIVDGEPVQIVVPSLRVPLPVKDLSAWLEWEHESEAARLAKEEADTPFDLENGPLIRSQLIRLSDLDHILLLTLHHIIFDGWSRRIFARELATCYEAFQRGQS